MAAACQDNWAPAQRNGNVMVTRRSTGRSGIIFAVDGYYPCLHKNSLGKGGWGSASKDPQSCYIQTWPEDSYNSVVAKKCIL